MVNYILKKNADLKNYCTFKIGGTAKLLFEVYNIKYLYKVCLFCKTHHIKFKIIGCGANLLFDDGVFSGAIIVNKASKIYIKNSSVFVFSGTNINLLINKCKQKKLSGLEHFAGIPSTVGGALCNNLGAFGFEISDFIDYVTCLRKTDFKLLKLNKNSCNFEYRNSIFKNDDYIILKAKLTLKPDTLNNIITNLTTALTKKSNTQPLNLPSAGSIFKRCEIIPSKVIDILNLKGLTVGGAQISTKHAGFIVNINNATSKDVKTLIDIISKKVYLHYNVKLMPEIEFVKI